jgi:hypothetical protein
MEEPELEFPVRRLALAGATAALALSCIAGSAQATPVITGSTISSPTPNSYFAYDLGAAGTTPVLTVSGTTTGSGNVDIRCYGGNGSSKVATLATNVPVVGNAFSVAVTVSQANSVDLGGFTCVLRAVPTGDATYYAPGSSSSFPGPQIAVSDVNASTAGGTTYDFRFALSDFSGVMGFSSPGDCGLAFGALYAPGMLTRSPTSFSCLGALFDPQPTASGPAARGEITVDGVEALDSDRANHTVPGYQGLTLADSFSAGVVTIHDDEPILACVPSYATCTSYRSSGVELDRTWQSAGDGRLALQTDSFRSVDGHQHSLAVLEDDDIARSAYPPGASFLFPGSSGFQDYPVNAMVALPSGPGTIEFKTDSATPDAGDATNPQGAITYGSPPNGGPVDFTFSDQSGSTDPEFVLPYTRTIPAGGSVALRFGYAQDYQLSSVQALSQTVLASFAPTVSITSPGGGTTVDTSSVTVTGTASDPTGINSVTVNGQAATLDAGGAFSAPVTLAPGANTITAVASDGDGITGQQEIMVTYRKPPAVLTGTASDIMPTAAQITGTVNPEGQPTTYQVQYGTSISYGTQTTSPSAGAGSAPVAAGTTLVGLTPNTTYHYRLTATNESATSYGDDATLHTPKLSPTRLGAKASPLTATSFPYRYTVKGKLSFPRGTTTACSGRITVRVKRGRTTIYTTRATVGHRCRWKASVTLTHRRKVPGQGTLRLTLRFGGSPRLAGFTGKPITVRYR